MSPYERIWREYEARKGAGVFSVRLGFNHQHGFVFSTPDYFAMGYRIAKDSGAPDAWFIEAMSGSMAKLWRVFQVVEPLHWVAFTRLSDNTETLTFVETSRLRRLCPPDLSSVDAPPPKPVLAQA